MGRIWQEGFGGEDESEEVGVLVQRITKRVSFGCSGRREGGVGALR